MNRYIIIAGVNGTGKSSLRGVLEGQEVLLGHIIDADAIAKMNNYDNIKAGKKAVEEIKYCLDNNISFTQETTLSGHRTEKTIQQARKQGYYVIMYYVGLNSKEESLARIENRVRKGGYDIPKNDVCRRFDNRFDSLKRIVPLCDEVIFYDNENGFAAVAEYRNGEVLQIGNRKPEWLAELMKYMEK